MKNVQLKYDPRDPSGKDPMNLFDRLTITAEIGGETFYRICEIHKKIEQLSVQEIVEIIGELLDSMNNEEQKLSEISDKINKRQDKGQTVRVKKREEHKCLTK